MQSSKEIGLYSDNTILLAYGCEQIKEEINTSPPKVKDFLQI